MHSSLPDRHRRAVDTNATDACAGSFHPWGDVLEQQGHTSVFNRRVGHHRIDRCLDLPFLDLIHQPAATVFLLHPTGTGDHHIEQELPQLRRVLELERVQPGRRSRIDSEVLRA